MRDLRSANIQLIVIGCSAGGVDALAAVLGPLPRDFRIPVAAVLHVAPGTRDLFSKGLAARCRLAVAEAEEKEKALPGHLYLAPADYHLLIEKDGTFSFSSEGPVSYSRPSVDVLFASAARSFRTQVLGIVLTGANFDGAEGLMTILDHGGYGVIEDPATAFFPEMPRAALKAARPDAVLPLSSIAELLLTLDKSPSAKTR